MTPDQHNLNRLFEEARNEAPQLSYEQVAETFSQSLLNQTASSASLLSQRIPALKFILPGLLMVSLAGYFWTASADEVPIAPEWLSSKAILVEQPKEALSLTAEVYPDNLPDLPDITPASDPIKETPQSTPLQTSLPEVEKQVVQQGKGQTTGKQIIPPREEKNLQDTIPPREIKSPLTENLSSTAARPQPEAEWVQYTIDQNSTSDDLLFICRQAKRAGLYYSYTTDKKKKQLAEFNAYLQIKGSDQFTAVEVAVPSNEAFEVTFGWLADEDGKAIDLTDHIILQKADPKHRLKENIISELRVIYQRDGVLALQSAYQEKASNLDKKVEAHWLLNTMGYEYLAAENYSQALEIFDLNTRLHPREA
ncbi:MAG: hypothetical protein AAFV80_16360, partial [Bacteroidota bacterium]